MPWTSVSKPALGSVVAARGLYYGFGALTYSGGQTISTTDNFTKVGKPTGTNYTNIAKPTGGRILQVGMITGLLIPLTNSKERNLGSPWVNVLKPI